MKKSRTVNLIFLSLIILGLLIILTEIMLRIIWDLGNPLLYVADDQIGYLIAPNQKTRRSGNLIQINKYSMRSKSIKPIKDEQTLRILLIGDSIANGGWWTDQNKTISALLEQQLSKNISNFTQVEVLNASANSWNPRNELAYLKKFGTFDSQIIIILINTDDFYGQKPSSFVVGNHPSYLDQKVFFALQELWYKNQLKNRSKSNPNKAQKETNLVDKNLNAITAINNIAQEKQLQFILAITPLKSETIPPYGKTFQKRARTKLEELTKNQNIEYIDFLPIFQEQENPETLYHDHIHLNDQGTKLVSQILEEKILLNLP